DLIGRGAAELWVAEDGQFHAVVGWISFGDSRDGDAPPAVGEIEAIYVLPSSWSIGIGRGLWEVARTRLLERGFTSVTLWVLEENARARAFYRAAGFAPNPASAKEITIGGKPLREIRYERNLASDPEGGT